MEKVLYVALDKRLEAHQAANRGLVISLPWSACIRRTARPAGSRTSLRSQSSREDTCPHTRHDLHASTTWVSNRDLFAILLRRTSTPTAVASQSRVTWGAVAVPRLTGILVGGLDTAGCETVPFQSPKTAHTEARPAAPRNRRSVLRILISRSLLYTTLMSVLMSSRRPCQCSLSLRWACWRARRSRPATSNASCNLAACSRQWSSSELTT
mmetsp:Transcript_112585/g.257886  ORF Transcript_112585/g.257886 Transcript_112585/m.257886 type:complete len:211 (+) Transcript_112585:2001-2633(+)